jgi:hypothetical protein
LYPDDDDGAAAHIAKTAQDATIPVIDAIVPLFVEAATRPLRRLVLAAIVIIIWQW